MNNYIITYIGGNRPATPEEGRRHFAKYRKWLDALGETALSVANPIVKTITIAPDGSQSEGSSVSMSGYTLIQADSLESAVKIASDCPFLENGGTLEVGQIGELPS